MRRYEILPIIDVLTRGLNELHKLMKEERSILYEDKIKDYANFISNTKNNLPTTPIVGAFYCPITLIASPIIGLLNIQQTNSLVKYVGYKSDTKKFEFIKHDGTIIKFPAATQETIDLKDLVIDTCLFTEVQDAEHFITLLSLQFSDWRLSIHHQ